MATSTIDPDAAITTLINVFHVQPDKQQELVSLLNEATEAVMRHRDGFVSANINASRDGHTVVNYAQWRDEAAFRAMLADPAAQEHMSSATALATSDPKLYTVAATHHA